MSKELEALARIELHLPNTKMTASDIHLLKQALTELEELKKRDKPMKVILTPYKKVVGNVDEFYIGNMYSCPQCHSVVLMDKWRAPIEHLKAVGEISNYCSSCGKRLDWSDDK